MFWTWSSFQDICLMIYEQLLTLSFNGMHFLHIQKIYFGPCLPINVRQSEVLPYTVSSNGKTARKFIIPDLNFDANNYYYLLMCGTILRWHLHLLYLRSLKIYGLLLRNLRIPKWKKLRSYPCHTQAVDRAVKLVTEAAVSVCDELGKMLKFNNIKHLNN